MTKGKPFYILVTFFKIHMKLYVDQIPDEGLELDYQEPADSFDYLKKEEMGAGGRVNGPIDVIVRAAKKPGGVAVAGRLHGSAVTNCGRCLDEFVEDVSHAFFYNCFPQEAMKEEGEELSRESTDVYYYSDDGIDVTALIQEQVALALPMRPLCKEDCKGLCPKCGANLNLGDCKCPKSPIDLRFAALRNLKMKG